jgi:hypothetical protein
MSNKKYRKFLEKQSEKNPIDLDNSISRGSLRITWAKNKEELPQGGSSHLLDSIYLGKDMEETVVVDRRVAGMLQDRLKSIEGENLRLRKRVGRLKLMLIAVAATALLLFAVLLNLYLPQLGIML